MNGKTVCDLGGGTGVLLHLAEFYGAEKCISIDNNPWCVYIQKVCTLIGILYIMIFSKWVSGQLDRYIPTQRYT